MPDPIDELSNFEPGVPVSPIPAAEVRRRGERLRRRRTALAMGGAVAAVVLIAVPVAVVASGGKDDGGTPQPATPVITDDDSLTTDELPVRDRLTPWEPMAAEGQVLSCAPQLPASLDETRGYRQDFRADIADAPADEIPSSVIRSQVLQFDNATEAREAYDQAQGWNVGCPGGDNLARKDVSVTSYELEHGQGEWRLHEFYAPDICTECDATRFERMGIAQFEDRMILVSLAEVGGPLEPEGLDESMMELFDAAVAKADGVITGAGSSGEATEVPKPEALGPALEAGLSEPDGVEVTREGPGPQAPGAQEVAPCGQTVWRVDGVDRLAVTETGTGYAESREVVELAGADDAAAAMADLRSAVSACPTEVNEFDPTNSPEMAWTMEPADTGYEDSVTFAQTYVDGMPGGAIWQFTRVGRAILVTFVGGEYAPGRSVTMAVDQLTQVTRSITPAMCEYTEDGC